MDQARAAGPDGGIGAIGPASAGVDRNGSSGAAISAVSGDHERHPG